MRQISLFVGLSLSTIENEVSAEVHELRVVADACEREIPNSDAVDRKGRLRLSLADFHVVECGCVDHELGFRGLNAEFDLRRIANVQVSASGSYYRMTGLLQLEMQVC